MSHSSLNLFALVVLCGYGASANENSQISFKFHSEVPFPVVQCQPSGCGQPQITPRSCLDYLKAGYKNNGYYEIYEFRANSFMTVYCDFASEPGAAWTLIMSFSLKNKGLPEFYKHPLQTDVPVNEKSPNWNLYRMSMAQMEHLKSQSTHWRATCSFPSYGVDYTDYARANFADFDIMTYLGHGQCKKMEYVNIRGHHCVQCTARWWQVLNTYGPHIDSSSSGCQLVPTAKSVPSEDNFGVYHFVSDKFRCTSHPSATTNWWFGAYK